MHLVERMTISPSKCLYCGRGHTADEDGKVGPYLDLERDVSWGDAVYLCLTCVRKIAALCGYVDEGQMEELNHIIQQKNQELHDQAAAYESRIRRIKAVRTGAKAARQLKKEAASA